MGRLWHKMVNRETVSYVFFGVVTTLTDWIWYWTLERIGVDYRVATAVSWAAAVAVAFITNKLFVFRSKNMHWTVIKSELMPFVGARVATGVFTLAAMMVMVDGLKIRDDFFCKVVVSVISLFLNYVLSKWFIFKEGKSSQRS